MFSHIFRTEFVQYNPNYTRAAPRPASIKMKLYKQTKSVLLTQRQKDAEDHGTMCLYRGTMELRHSFTCPYQGQAFLYVKSGSKQQ